MKGRILALISMWEAPGCTPAHGEFVGSKNTVLRSKSVAWCGLHLSLKEWSGAGTACPGRWWNHRPWQCSGSAWTKCYDIWFSSLVGSIGDRRMVGLDDLVGPFQPCVSMILWICLCWTTMVSPLWITLVPTSLNKPVCRARNPFLLLQQNVAKTVSSSLSTFLNGFPLQLGLLLWKAQGSCASAKHGVSEPLVKYLILVGGKLLVKRKVQALQSSALGGF